MALWGPTSSTTHRPRVVPRGALLHLPSGWHDVLEHLSELPVLARYAGHAIVALLLATAAGTSAPEALRTTGSTLLPTVDGSASRQAAYSPKTTPSEQVVEAAVLPSTYRALRGVIMPSITSQRAVRTSVITYTVQENDTVLGIAAKFGLKGDSLLWANERLADNPDFLSIGQTLNILPVDGALHTVAAGETIESIAEKYKVQASAILEYAGNALEPPYTLQTGQQLIIPGGTKPYVARAISYGEASAPSSAQRATGSLLWPMAGRISQGYWYGHLAIDIAAAKGTPIYAVDNGYVSTAQWSDVGYGRMVIINHGNGTQTLYAHMSTYYVSAGEAVQRGQLVGICGSTGNSTGPHLHFEVIRGGSRVNPFNYLP